MRNLLLSLVAGALLALQSAEAPKAAGVEVGQMVPAFRLNDSTGRAVSVSAPKPGESGKWTVLAFYPKAATPG